jgi:hypothetical protein
MTRPPVDPRIAEMIRITKGNIDEQIEVVAKAVCEGGQTERAMCVLSGLAKRLAMLETRAVLLSTPPPYMQSPSSVPAFDE